MNFIFPQNYKFKNKFLGIVDYYSLFVNAIWCCFIFCLINLLFTNLTFKIFIFIILCLPLLLFSIFEINNENILFNIIYLLKFLCSNKVYLFNKFYIK